MNDAISHRRRALFLAPALAALLLALVVFMLAGSARAAITMNVTSTNDATDSDPGDGVCVAPGGGCTLRAAIQEANALPGTDTVNLPAGEFALSRAPLNENGIATGDLDVTDDLIINGAGRINTFIDGGEPPLGSPPDRRGLDRLFEIHHSVDSVQINRVTIREGYAAEYGGAIFNAGAAIVTVSGSSLSRNLAAKTGGAIENHADGSVVVSGSVLSGNVAEGGGAINNNSSGTLEVSGGTISGNSGRALGGGSAILNNAALGTVGSISITGATISRNTGGAIENAGAGMLTVDGTKFLDNTTTDDGAAINNESGGEVMVTGSSFSGNEAVNGGAINNGDALKGGGALTVRNSTFGHELAAGNNTATAQGGAINNTGTATLAVLEGSKFYGNSAAGEGGAIQNADKGSVEIIGATFAENTGLNGGGFANNGDGLVIVDGSDFLRNKASAVGEGGGLHTNSDGGFELTGGSFTGNEALDGGGLNNDGDGTVDITGTKFSGNIAQGEGGGISVHSGKVTVVNAEVLTNSAVVGGGGIAYQGDAAVNLGRSANITNTKISGNTTQGTGGGIDSRGDGVLGLTATTVSSNTAELTGGAIHHVGDAELNVIRSTLSGNRAESPPVGPGEPGTGNSGEVGSGGGLFTDGDGPTMFENTTVSGNTATNFGGGLLVSSRATLNNVTVTGNSAPSGGGINNGGGDLVGDGLVFLRNTIVAGNPQGGNCAGTMTSFGGNVDSADTCNLRARNDQPATDPLLGPLADNGGLTFTHDLLTGSPAQDRALCAITTPEEPPCPRIDQRTITRPQHKGYDVGAFESELPPGDPGSTPCAARTVRTLLANQDSWISQGSPATNFGANAILKVKSQNTSNSRALVRFDLPAAPPGCELVGAKLRLHSSSATDGRTLQAIRLGSAWSEAGVTWRDQPVTAPGTPATARSGLGYRQWNVLAQTKRMYEVQNHGFLIRDATENSTGFEQSFHSREKGAADSPPELVLTFDDLDTPPPCSTEPLRLAADADSWINQADPAKNFGLDPILKVRSQSAANSRALVRFPLPALPSGCTAVKSATLRMQASSSPEGQVLRAFRLGASWTETGVTWANQPAKTGVAVTATATPEDLLQWNVVEQVNAMYPSANYGFLIRYGAENGTGLEQGLHSREKPLVDNPPQLEITFE